MQCDTIQHDMTTRYNKKGEDMDGGVVANAMQCDKTAKTRQNQCDVTGQEDIEHEDMDGGKCNTT